MAKELMYKGVPAHLCPNDLNPWQFVTAREITDAAGEIIQKEYFIRTRDLRAWFYTVYPKGRFSMNEKDVNPSCAFVSVSVFTSGDADATPVSISLAAQDSEWDPKNRYSYLKQAVSKGQRDALEFMGFVTPYGDPIGDLAAVETIPEEEWKREQDATDVPQIADSSVKTDDESASVLQGLSTDAGAQSASQQEKVSAKNGSLDDLPDVDNSAADDGASKAKRGRTKKVTEKQAPAAQQPVGESTPEPTASPAEEISVSEIPSPSIVPDFSEPSDGSTKPDTVYHAATGLISDTYEIGAGLPAIQAGESAEEFSSTMTFEEASQFIIPFGGDGQVTIADEYAQRGPSRILALKCQQLRNKKNGKEHSDEFITALDVFVNNIQKKAS